MTSRYGREVELGLSRPERGRLGAPARARAARRRGRARPDRDPGSPVPAPLPGDVGADRRPDGAHRARPLLPGRRQPAAPLPRDDREARGDARPALGLAVRARARHGRLLGRDRRHGRARALAARGLRGARGGDRDHPSLLVGRALDRVRGAPLPREGAPPGPAPAHPIEIWLGVAKPRSLELLGRAADGWVPSLTWARPEVVPPMMHAIDESAREAGRDPGEIRRLLNVSGKIVDGDVTELLVGPPEHWIETLTGFASDLGFDTFVLWPNDEPVEQLERFATEVAPALR